MTPIIWQDRLVKIDEGTVLVSAKGRHDDFEFAPPKMHKEMAFAFRLDTDAYEVEPAGETLLVRTTGGTHVLSCDDVYVMKLSRVE